VNSSLVLPFRKRKSHFCVVVLDSAVTAQNFEYKMSNNPENLLYVRLSYPPVSHHRIENRCLVISPYFLGPSARTSTLSPRTTLMASVRYRSTCSGKQWCEHLNSKREDRVDEKCEVSDIGLLSSYNAFRILHWGLVSKLDGYGFFTTSSPRTDTPDQVPELFSQCCRWFNQGFNDSFVAIRSTVKLHYIRRSS